MTDADDGGIARPLLWTFLVVLAAGGAALALGGLLTGRRF